MKKLITMMIIVLGMVSCEKASDISTSEIDNRKEAHLSSDNAMAKPTLSKLAVMAQNGLLCTLDGQQVTVYITVINDGIVPDVIECFCVYDTQTDLWMGVSEENLIPCDEIIYEKSKGYEKV